MFTLFDTLLARRGLGHMEILVFAESDAKHVAEQHNTQDWPTVCWQVNGCARAAEEMHLTSIAGQCAPSKSSAHHTTQPCNSSVFFTLRC